ncbi:MAG: ATP-dependent RecD-like DNA helicase [Verrucomicrobia bacterium]|nr:ATP-dependent RecD-like DNA helicase [Verrucomicrobiota bacterium]MBT7065731.1 ATP-dependent RecD-like DNA helicase [Verrucomicrobiota bacterium]MBT7699486.1 ATP-dependent RecD-like DNA helicase [Verrucomicrobiota bacterium]
MNTPPKKQRGTNEANEVLTGTVENIVYRAEETGYTVCGLRVSGRKDAVTVVGTCAAIWAGETLRTEGTWTRHPKHGYQFQAASMICVAPTSAHGIERYLASGMVKGIGKVMAQRLVAAFGDDTLRIIDKESERLREVDGIGPKRRGLIKDSWIEQHAVRDIMIFLQSHGMGTAQAARIYRQYGSQAVAIISENPYQLCRDVWGVGFKTADGVAKSIGVPPQSKLRARAGLVYTMETLASEGHCFCLDAELILQAQDLLDIPAEILSEALASELERSELVRDDNRIYLASLYHAETGVAERLITLSRSERSFRPIVVEKAVAWAGQRMKLEFAPMQVQALQTALAEKVSVITGGPGVGKTTIIRALVDVYRARGLTIALAAPTGRAAKRMEEATHHAASTLHRLLKFNPAVHGFEHDRANPLAIDVVILDECSMIDIALMQSFLNALPDPCCLVLVGDIDQLPSVGPGNVLRDIIDSEVIAYRRLDHIFRQDKGGAIVRNAHHVNHGEALETGERAESSDFFFISAEHPEDVIDKMLQLITRRIPAKFGFNPIHDIQVLTPMRRNQLGAENLNGLLQQALNPTGAELQRFGRAYRDGDRVMQIRNNYDKEVFNGDIGLVHQINSAEQELTVDFDGRRVTYAVNELDELVLAYACSIHKSQGSEYPAVIILMTTQHFKLLQRNLLYTAITRGRKLVCLVGQQKAIGMAIRNNEIRLRRTALRQRLAMAG